MLVLIGAGFEVCGVGVEYTSLDQFLLDSLKNNFIEDLLVNVGIIKPPTSVLAQGRGIRDGICQI